MDQVELACQLRSVTGKKVKTLRAEGLAPLIVYGTTDPVNIQAVEFDVKRAIEGARGQLMALHIEGEENPRTVLAREVQYDAISGVVLHADMYEVDVTARIEVQVSLNLVGEPKLVTNGEAILLPVLNAVEIECLPTEIMQSIEVDVSKLVDMNDAFMVSDLMLPESVRVLTPSDEMIVRLELLEEEEEEEEEEVLEFVEPGEVEVIQRGRAEAEEEGEA